MTRHGHRDPRPPRPPAGARDTEKIAALRKELSARVQRDVGERHLADEVALARRGRHGVGRRLDQVEDGRLPQRRRDVRRGQGDARRPGQEPRVAQGHPDEVQVRPLGADRASATSSSTRSSTRRSRTWSSTCSTTNGRRNAPTPGACASRDGTPRQQRYHIRRRRHAGRAKALPNGKDQEGTLVKEGWTEADAKENAASWDGKIAYNGSGRPTRNGCPTHAEVPMSPHCTGQAMDVDPVARRRRLRRCATCKHSASRGRSTPTSAGIRAAGGVTVTEPWRVVVAFNDTNPSATTGAGSTASSATPAAARRARRARPCRHASPAGLARRPRAVPRAPARLRARRGGPRAAVRALRHAARRLGAVSELLGSSPAARRPCAGSSTRS